MVEVGQYLFSGRLFLLPTLVVRLWMSEIKQRWKMKGLKIKYGLLHIVTVLKSSLCDSIEENLWYEVPM